MSKSKEKVICPYCGKEFSRITPNHLKTHGIAWEDYLKEHRPIKYMENLLIEFFNEFYITTRYKYLIYPPDGNTYTAKADAEKGIYPLNKQLLQEHLEHKQTIGVFFPTLGSKLIGLDLDIQDLDALERVYNTVTRYVPETSVLITSSGGKGHHIEIFLNRILNRDIIKRFYDIILEDTGLNSKELELRGASDQGWKLPFGMHFKKNAYCYACNQFGVVIDINNLEPLIKSRTKANIEDVIKAVEINADDCGEITLQDDIAVDILSDEEIITFEDIASTVELLPNYENLQEDFISDLSMIYRRGFAGSGLRSKYTFKIALFLKCHMKFKKNMVLEEMYDWMDKCKGYTATEEEFKKDIENTVDRIFKKDLKLSIAARTIEISKIEIKEILSIKCKSPLQTRALRQLYYILTVHSKAYSDADSVFFMTREQMQSMGANKNKNDLSKQINKLIELGKIYKYPTKRISRVRYAPGEYKLTALSGYKIPMETRVFKLCRESIMCKDCLEKASCFLITNNQERYKYLKGKYEECPYNKR